MIDLLDSVLFSRLIMSFVPKLHNDRLMMFFGFGRYAASMSLAERTWILRVASSVERLGQMQSPSVPSVRQIVDPKVSRLPTGPKEQPSMR